MNCEGILKKLGVLEISCNDRRNGGLRDKHNTSIIIQCLTHEISVMTSDLLII